MKRRRPLEEFAEETRQARIRRKTQVHDDDHDDIIHHTTSTTVQPLLANAHAGAGDPLYSSLHPQFIRHEDEDVSALFDVECPIGNNAGAEYVEHFVNEVVMTDAPATHASSASADSVFKTRVCGKVVNLHNPPRIKEKQKISDKKSQHSLARKAMSQHQKKKLGMFDISNDVKKFHLFEPLHELWGQYIADLVKKDGLQNMQARLPKADYHGALMTVIQSRCPSYIGISGIMIMETANTFKIITRENKLKIVPKQNSIFSLPLAGNEVRLYGNNFCVRPAERISKKWKFKPTIEL